MRALLAILLATTVCPLGAQRPVPAPPPKDGADAPAYVEPYGRWLRSDHTDDDLRLAAAKALLDAGPEALPWLGQRLRAAAGATAASQSAQVRALHRLATDVVLGFVDRQRSSGVVHRGQYLPLRALDPFATQRLFDLLLRTPDWFSDTRRVHLVPALVDLQPGPPAPELLLGVTDLIENAEVEPADLRVALSCLVWQWGRKGYVEERAAALRQASAEGDVEDRLQPLRDLADLWYRVGEHAMASATHVTLAAMADSAHQQLTPTDWYWGACYLSLAGRVDDGIAALERCAALLADDAVEASRKLPRKLFETDPEIAALRADPRFAAILARAFPAARSRSGNR
ncbi:MAG: hypothetical protein AB7O97_11980 [Planctomycetota bacterium]